MCIALALDNGEPELRIGPHPSLTQQHPGIFSNGHPIDHRNGLHADKTPKGGIQHGAIHILTIGIGPVQDDERTVVFDSRFHIALQGSGISVETNPHVLDIVEHNIDVAKIGGAGLMLVTIKRDDRNTRFGVHLVAYSFSCIGIATETMFGRKDPDDMNAPFNQRVHHVAAIYQCGVVGEYGHTLALQQRKVLV